MQFNFIQKRIASFIKHKYEGIYCDGPLAPHVGQHLAESMDHAKND